MEKDDRNDNNDEGKSGSDGTTSYKTKKNDNDCSITKATPIENKGVKNVASAPEQTQKHHTDYSTARTRDSSSSLPPTQGGQQWSSFGKHDCTETLRDEKKRPNASRNKALMKISTQENVQSIKQGIHTLMHKRSLQGTGKAAQDEMVQESTDLNEYAHESSFLSPVCADGADDDADDEESNRPGAFSIPGINSLMTSTHNQSELLSSEVLENDPPAAESMLPQVSAVLVDDTTTHPSRLGSGRAGQELEELRQQLANTVRAQEIDVYPPNHATIKDDEDETQVASWFSKCCKGFFFKSLVAAGVFGVILIAVLTIGRPWRAQESNASSHSEHASDTAHRGRETTPAPFDLPWHPSHVPTVDPTSGASCDIDIRFACLINRNGNFPGFDCSSYNNPQIGNDFEECQHPPDQVVMSFNGGRCNETDVVTQIDHVNCTDTKLGQRILRKQKWLSLYCVVTDAVGKGLVYYEGYIQMFDELTIQSFENGLLDQGLHFTLYRNNNTLDASNLLQDIVYEQPLCSTPMKLSTAIGTFVLYEFTNELQGTFSIYSSGILDMSIDLVFENVGSQALEIVSYSQTINDQLENMTDAVQGVILAPNQTWPVPLYSNNVDWLAAVNITYMVKLREHSGQICMHSDMQQITFTVGTTPTTPPVLPPPTNQSCIIESSIVCAIVDFYDDPLGTCEDIVDYQGMACSGDMEVFGLGFEYIGRDSFPDTVFIEVAGAEQQTTVPDDDWFAEQVPNGLVHNATMSVGDVFRVTGPFPNTIEINLYSLDGNGWPDKKLNNVTIDGKCVEGKEELRLSSIYGDALKLVMFENAYGFYATTYLAKISYTVQNVGEVAFLLNTNESEFQYVNQSTPNKDLAGQPLPPGSSFTIFDTMKYVTFEEIHKESPMVYSMYVTGTTGDGLECSNETELTI